MSSLRFLLLQTRNADDPMRQHEVASFARALETSADRISVIDLLSRTLERRHLAGADMVLLGGSGDYSAAGDGGVVGPGIRFAAIGASNGRSYVCFVLGLSGDGPCAGRRSRA